MPTNVLSIINSSESALRHKTKFYCLPVFETNASKDYDDANDYINSMSQFNTTTIKSHSIPDYAPVPMPIRSHEPMKILAEQQTIPLIIDVSNDELSIIVSLHSDSKPAISKPAISKASKNRQIINKG